MADGACSAGAGKAEKLVAYVQSPASAAASSSSSSSRNCDVGKIREDAKRLIRMLDMIQARLDDAEKWEVTDDFIHHWLRELEGVACDAEDVLDEFSYEAIRLGLMEDGGLDPESHSLVAIEAVVNKMEEVMGPQSKITVGETQLQVSASTSSLQSHETLAFLCCVEQRIEQISSRFDEIKEHKRALWFEGDYKQRHDETPVRQPASSFMEEPCIFGREEDLEAVKRFLLSDGESRDGNRVPVMAVVGMGGLGKTTLVQHAYNDGAVNMRFPLKSWICVSEDFDLVRLTKAMVEAFNQDACGFSELNDLQVKLKGTLTEQRFLLVLDDIWEAQTLSKNWDRLIAPLRYGAAGSKIILTTRSEKVSKICWAISTYRLPCLQDDACMKLFSQRAFEGWDPSSNQNLMALGRKISKRCRGLPLVAKTLGGLLHCVEDESMWNNILESDVWDFNEENEIMAVLRLSYQHLPPQLKRCFRYCSVFPKDYRFDKDALVRMWMAHGYIRAKEGKLMEDVGKDYFDDLFSRSFFQCSQETNIFLMHDLIHDLARCVSRGECWSVDDDTKPCLIPSNTRHFSIVTIKDRMQPIWSTSSTSNSGSPGSYITSEPRSVRSFLYISTSWSRFNIVMLPNGLLTRMEHLRVLDLNAVWLLNLPKAFVCLKHLRYLRLRGEGTEQLPEALWSLYHLQTLDLGQFDSSGLLSEEWHDRLPGSILNLLNLRHIIYGRNNLSVEYPMGIGKLTDLQTMPGFHVSQKYDCAKLGELKDIKNIQGKLVITGINNLTDAHEAKKACLEEKRNLRFLDLRCNYSIDPSHIEKAALDKPKTDPFYTTDPSHIEKEALDKPKTDPFYTEGQVLESLKPTPKLENLCISCCRGQSFPSWLGHPSFSKLASVELNECENWTSLPPLGQLPSLRSLSITSADQVESIGSEFFYGGFPQLETLRMRMMHKWKAWSGAQRGECPRLQLLSIRDCRHLTSLSVTNLDALQDLEIKGCPALQFSTTSLQIGQLPSLQTIFIKDIHRAEFIHGVFSSAGIGKSYLELENVGELEAWSVAALARRFHIDRLTLTGCANLTSLPLGKLHAVAYVMVSECPQLQFSNADKLPATLQVLRMNRCPSATKWCNQNRQRLAHIPILEIEDCHLVLRNVLNVHVAANVDWTNLFRKVRILELEWDCSVSSRPDADVIADKLIEKLQSREYLGKLMVRGYMGWRWPSCLGDGSLFNLFSVTLLHCSQCKTLPPLGQLRSLIKLYVEGASKLECIGHEFFTDGGDNRSTQGSLPSPSHDMTIQRDLTEEDASNYPLLYKLTSSGVRRRSFPALTVLEFHDMPLWKAWEGSEEGDFPSLGKLILKRCRSLRALPHLPPTLKELELEACQELRSLSSSDSSIQPLQSLTSLKCLSLTDCPNLVFSASDSPPSTIKYMALSHCPQLMGWCNKHLSMLVHVTEIWLDGTRAYPEGGEILSIRSQRRRTH